MKLTSQAWKNSRSSTGRAEAVASGPSSAARLSRGKPSAPSAKASFCFFALLSAARWDAPGAKGDAKEGPEENPVGCVCSPNAPNTGLGAEETPKRG